MSDRLSDTVDPGEIGKFDAIAGDWWNPDGQFKPLHRMNPIRLDYIRDQLCAQFGKNPKALRPLADLKVADVGCGGGLLCEPLARMGATVTGIDASSEAINAARRHAAGQGIEIDYRAETADAVGRRSEKFDAVLAMEIVEHVTDISTFLTEIHSIVRPGGLVILSTINRTAKSYALAIAGAEYLLRWLPRGTHDWNKFPTPKELETGLESVGLTVVDDTGFRYDLIRDHWSRTDDLSVNYALVAERKEEPRE